MKLLRFFLPFLALLSPQIIIAQCEVNTVWEFYPAPLNGSYGPGQTITICVSDTGTTLINGGKINGIELLLPNGWDIASIDPLVMPETCPDNPGQWIFSEGLTCAGGEYGPGFYFDGGSDPSSDPCANNDDGCETSNYNWYFCFEITTRTDCTSDPLLPGSELTPGIRLLNQSDLSGSDIPLTCGGDGLVAYAEIEATFNCCDVQAGINPAPAPNCNTGNACLFDLLEGEPTPGGIWTNQFGDLVENCMVGPIPSGIYQYLVTGTSGCVSTATVEITSNDLGIIQNLPYCDSSPFQICQIVNTPDINTLCDATYYYPGYPETIVEVPNGIIDPSSDPPGIYHGRILNENGCPTYFQLNLTLINVSTMLNSTVEICNNDGIFCPFDALNQSQTGNPGIGTEGQWIVYNSNFGFISFHSSHAVCGFENLFNVVTPSTFYFVFVQGNPPCAPQYDTLTVNVNPVPQAGPDQNFSFCAQQGEINLYDLLPANVDSTGTWSLEPLDIAFPNGDFNLASYADESPVQLTYTLSNETCSDEAFYNLTISSIESIQLPSYYFCPGAPTFPLYILFMSYTDDPSGFLIGPSGYNPAGGHFTPGNDPEGIYSYTVYGPCGFLSFHIAISSTESISAGPDGISMLCEQAGGFNLNSLLSPSNPIGGFWIGGPSINLLPENSGYYQYVISGAGCQPDTAEFNLTIIPALEAQYITTTCNSLSSYQVNFQIVGGTPPYIINGSITMGSSFSQNMPVGSPYFFTIYDSSGPCISSIVSGSAPTCSCNIAAIFGPVETSICSAQLINIPVLLYGQSPFSLTYSIDGISTTINDINSIYYVISHDLETVSTIELLEISDAICTMPLDEVAIFTVIENPEVTDLGLVQTFIYCNNNPVSLSDMFAPANAVPANSIWYYPDNITVVPNGLFNPGTDEVGVYTVHFNSEFGCPMTQSLAIYTSGGQAQNASASICSTSNFCPFELLDDSNPDIDLYTGGQWILYNENFSFISFSQNWDDCTWAPIGQVEETTTFNFVYIIGNPPCAPVIDTLQVTVNPNGTVITIEEVTLCADGSLFDLNTLLPDGIQGQGWSGDSLILLFENQSDVYEYVGDISCGIQVHVFDISIVPAPQLTNAFVVCSYDPLFYQISFDVSGGIPPYVISLGGTFTGATFLSDSIPVGLITTLSVTDAGSCTPTIMLFEASDIDGDGICDEGEIVGCQDPAAINFNPLATNPGICEYGFAEAPNSLSTEEPITGGIFIVGQDDSIFENRFQIQPNPSTIGNDIWVIFENAIRPETSISIYNIAGQRVFDNRHLDLTSRTVQITMNTAFSSGMYFVVVSSGGKVAGKKLILQN